MRRYVCLHWLIFILCIQLACASFVLAEGIGMVTGSKTGTYFRFGTEIAEKAATARLDILVKDSQGSIDNIRRLTSKENAAFAIVQSDVLGFLKRSDDPKMMETARRLRLIFPFYNEEVHLFANKRIQRFADLQGKRIVLGAEGSGNWLTSVNLLNLAGITPGEKLYLPPPDAVKAVLKDEADAMFYVAGKPVQVFLNLNEVKAEFPQLLDNVHFVPLDDPRMLAEYVSSEITPTDYAWFDKTIPTIAVKAVLISFDFSSQQSDYYRARCAQLGLLGSIIRKSLPDLQQTGHPKWKEVNLEQKMGIWELDTCSRQGTTSSAPTTLNNDLDKLLNKSWW